MEIDRAATDYRVPIMNSENAADIIRQTLFVAAEISAPMLIISLLLGLGISLFQSVTQITETTLILVPKIFFFGVTFAFTFPWILKILLRFTNDIFLIHWPQIMHAAT
jgi:flagellar biosynthetic protein FliQ